MPTAESSATAVNRCRSVPPDPCIMRRGCGANAVCEAKNHAAICRCRDGYEGDPVSGCQLIDYCIKQNPCHNSAICRNKFGGATCECPPEKHIGNPNGPPGCERSLWEPFYSDSCCRDFPDALAASTLCQAENSVSCALGRAHFAMLPLGSS